MNATETSLQSTKNKELESFSGGNSNGFIRSNSCDPRRVIRQYINPAVYVESSVFYDMAPFRRSPIFLNYASDEETSSKVVKVKRCVCFTYPNHCPCHPSNFQPNTEENAQRETELGKKVPQTNISQTSLKSENTDSGITIQFQDELKLSLPSLTSATTVRCNEEALKEDIFRSWCARKDQEKKLEEEKEALLRQIKEKERDMRLEEERENFKRWLINKKTEDERRRKEKEKQQQQEALKEELKLKRIQENELNYQLWLKKKEELYLEKKIQEQVKLLQVTEEKRARLEASMKAYEVWLKESKNKPRPIPLNQGLQTLRSSVSVTYVNPTPWVPNIDIKPKPASQ